MKQELFYVYALLDPRRTEYFKFGDWEFPAEPFYIGKGCGVRYRATKSDKGHTRKKYKVRAIRRAGFEPQSIILVRGLSENDAFEAESSIIALIGRSEDGGPLVNHTLGGGGLSGYNHREESRAKMRGPKSEQQVANMRLARARTPDRMTDEARAKISASLIGRALPVEVREKMKGRTPWNKGRAATPEEVEKLRAMALANSEAAAARRLAKPAPEPKPNGRKRKWTEEERALRSGWNHSDEAKRRIGDACRGKPRSEDVKAKIRATKAAKKAALLGTR